METQINNDLRSVVIACAKLRRFAQGAGGLSILFGWISAEKWRAIVVAAGWFVFCIYGLFPPPLWLWPVYIWMFLFFGGLLTQRARRTHVCGDKKNDELPTLPVYVTPEDLEDVHAAVPSHELNEMFLREAGELAPILAGFVSSLERVRNLLTFADGPASTVFFTGLGAALLVVALSLMIVVWVFGSVHYCIGMYGALLLVASALKADKLKALGGNDAARGYVPPSRFADSEAGVATPPGFPEFTVWRRLGIALTPPWGASVPDGPQLLHRVIAERLARPPANAAAGGSQVTRV